MPTSLMRRNSFDAIDLAQSRMWDWFTTPVGHTPISKLFGEANSYVPPVDIYETQEEVVVAASLPGVDAGKLDVQVVQDRLILSGEQNSVLCFEPEEKMVQHLQGIPRFGRFSFTFQLPCAVEADQSQANYQNGLLCMRFLKTQQNRPVKVAINIQNEPVNVTAAPSPQQITGETAADPGKPKQK